MKAEEISKINEANLVLRHFVNLSARLLPFLDELQRKRNPSKEDIRDKERIIDVYENYSFDTDASKMLLNSNVLDLIKDSFLMISRSSNFLRPHSKNPTLNRFLQEHQRLTNKWFQIDAN